MQYKYTRIEQERRKGDRRWITTHKHKAQDPFPETHWKQATCLKTMKFFRRFGRQCIKCFMEDGKQVKVLESYNTTGSDTKDYRIVCVYKEI